MSAADIPYQLRPNKFIDRQMFMELLLRLVVPRSPEYYIYVSMGGRHLIDHHAVYNELGIQAQYSFDKDANEVARQMFNRPTGRTHCVEMNTADLPSRLDQIWSEFPRKKNLIVWLDYTTADRRSQFQEAIQILTQLKHGDIFRITLNANLQTLGPDKDWKKSGAASPREYRADRLRAQIQEYMPTDVTTISDTEFPAVLARCMELATNVAEAKKRDLQITPVLITSYKDGTRMLTVTCAVSEKGHEHSFPDRLFSRWKFACHGWDDIQLIYAPVLSSKEQYRLDAYLHRGAKRMLGALKFLPAGDVPSSLEALRSYRDFHRYYPTFRHVED
ncbi:MAG: O-methyltransferase [Rhizomicrobium sp.]